MNYFPEEVLEHVFEYVESHRDRNSLAQVCKSWCRIERNSRQRVFIGNCYAVTAEKTAATFPALRSLTLKGKPHFADFNLVPHDWGGLLLPWIRALAAAGIPLEDLRLKRMIVSDDSLLLLSRSFPNFKSLLLVSCEGFTTDGLAAVASNCRNLRELDLQENEIEDHRGQWLSCFPENQTSLVSLSFACLRGEVNPAALERLVARSPDLKVLRVNRSVTLETLVRILEKAPGLTDLGTGSCVVQEHQFEQLRAALAKCAAMRSLSGFLEVAPLCLAAFHPLCSGLTSLNLSYAPGIHGSDLINILRHCTKLRRLWVLDCVGDKGLAVVASVCKELEELRVFPSGTGHATVTEDGLVSISAGCPKLHSLLYFCEQMTNAALFTVAKNCPNFIRFRLCILDPVKPDPVTSQPLDEGFGAIVRACKGLKRLSLTGLLTDKVFLYIGMYAERLEMLSVAFAGDTDKGMLYVLNGCKRMRKLEIRDSPFGDAAILADLGKYETMRSLWMSSCRLTLRACKAVAQGMPRVNVEIINDHPEFCGDDGEDYDDDHGVEKMYLYRSLVGPRDDAPEFVWTL